MDHGVKIAEGTPDKIRHDPKVISVYLGVEED
jgi:branched-chain amino acid transport system ATP-binding protein